MGPDVVDLPQHFNYFCPIELTSLKNLLALLKKVFFSSKKSVELGGGEALPWSSRWWHQAYAAPLSEGRVNKHDIVCI